MGYAQFVEAAPHNSNGSTDSGYASAPQKHDSVPHIFFSPWHLKFLNKQLAQLPPEDILRWCLVSLPGLFQETAFGLSGLVTVDMLSKLNTSLRGNVPLLFVDTLHNFDETIRLVDRVRARYPKVPIHTYRPVGAYDADGFAALYGEKLWEADDEQYDYVAKVEPTKRAYSELNIKAVLTGRRKAQGGSRKSLDIIEVDETGLIKVNPLANWSFDQVHAYIKENKVPYNDLLDRGYKSVGDWHSTSPVEEGEGERDGRWKGSKKTECGIHNPASRYFQFMMEQQKAQEEQAQQLSEKLEGVASATV